MRRIGMWLGLSQCVLSVLIAAAVWAALPIRWWVIDVTATWVAVVLAVGGMGLITGARWGVPLSRIAAGITLAFGLITTTMAISSVAFLSGVYGSVGKGGMIIFIVIALLLLAYVVIGPAIYLVVLTRVQRQPRL